ncbi:hypothetical protein C8R45DRAFT_1166414 [Mycena sanguinolenta]|nr:hypothetical protein C8R45DRAFT_1166414 [Mycena sanguinolenta]
MRSAKVTSRSPPFTAQHIARTAQCSARALSRTTEYFQGPGTESQRHRKWGRDRSADGYYLGGRAHPGREGTRRAKAMVKGEDNVLYPVKFFFPQCVPREAWTRLSPLGSHPHEDRDRDAESVSDVLRRVGIENCVAVSGFMESHRTSMLVEHLPHEKVMNVKPEHRDALITVPATMLDASALEPGGLRSYFRV